MIGLLRALWRVLRGPRRAEQAVQATAPLPDPLELLAAGATVQGTPPHCDSDILHAPGECHYCDAHPNVQAYRVDHGIAFTGHVPTGEQVPCPSEWERAVDVINRWPGNRPYPPGSFPALY